MYIGVAGLFLIVMASMFFGACVGMVVMALCKISALNKEDDKNEQADN